MLPIESRFVKFAENKCVNIYLYNSHPQMRLRSREVTKVKDFVQSVARNLNEHELTVNCNFINHEWRLNFIFLPVGSEQRIDIPYAIAAPELYRLNAERIASHVSDYILAAARRLVPRQTWRIHRRLIEIGNLSEYRYNVRVSVNREQRSFRARSVMVNIDEPICIGIDSSVDAENVPSFVFTQNQWIEIEAELDSGYCEVSNHGIIINNLLLNAYTLGYFDYGETLDFRIKPNIILESLLVDGDRITFEALPVNTHSIPRDLFSINRHDAITDFYRRRVADGCKATAPSLPIYNQKCKYFNGGDYLRCAANPDGACNTCKDFEAKC